MTISNHNLPTNSTNKEISNRKVVIHGPLLYSTMLNLKIIYLGYENKRGLLNSAQESQGSHNYSVSYLVVQWEGQRM